MNGGSRFGVLFAWLPALPVFTALLLCGADSAGAQTIGQRGFLEGSSLLFPQKAPNDATRTVVDFLAREEVFVKPTSWVQFAAGFDLRANSHDEVEDEWRLDFSDRGVRRPRMSIRRLMATFTRGRLTLDAGKQFIRWGKTDIINPTDRFAPRDFLNVVDNEFLAVTGVRAVVLMGSETLEGVWVPRFTPSRVPLLDERWAVLPPEASFVSIVDAGSVLPGRREAGIRWSHAGAGFECSLSFFDGLNHLPNIDTRVQTTPAQDQAVVPLRVDVMRVYPVIRAYGADAAVPTRWLTVKGEAAYFTSRSPGTDEYVLYVVQVERQSGEWLVVGGYAGEAVTARRAALTFAPDRGLTRSFVARASYTIDSERSAAIEGAARQNARGAYVKAEYSQARGQHWRATVALVVIRGEPDDFLGQFRRNSHVTLDVRYSF